PGTIGTIVLKIEQITIESFRINMYKSRCSMSMKDSDVTKTVQTRMEIMAKKRSNSLMDQTVTGISEDRRSKRRYPIELPVQYKVMKNYLVMGTGSGNSLDLSSGGIAFTSTAPLKIGSYLELSVSWPVMLNQSCPLKL